MAHDFSVCFWRKAGQEFFKEGEVPFGRAIYAIAAGGGDAYAITEEGEAVLSGGVTQRPGAFAPMQLWRVSPTGARAVMDFEAKTGGQPTSLVVDANGDLWAGMNNGYLLHLRKSGLEFEPEWLARRGA